MIRFIRGTPRNTASRRSSTGLLLVLVALGRLGLGRRGGRPGHAVFAGEPLAEIDQPAALGAERKRWILVLRADIGSAGRTPWHESAFCKQAGANFQPADASLVVSLTPDRFDFTRRRMPPERSIDRLVLVVDDD